MRYTARATTPASMPVASSACEPPMQGGWKAVRDQQRAPQGDQHELSQRRRRTVELRQTVSRRSRYDVPFRPLRRTEKPFVHGPQTAIVVGPPGEKIFTDKLGRVRVQFHWDRYGKHDDKSSCWIRVSQSWAGRGWGGVNLPHVGHEVVVSFLEGDPDRPLITGRVYNGENLKAMGMPENKTQSAIRDHSGNEIVMEGKGGSEDIRINATKDTNVVVTHDYNETVKTGNRKTEVSEGTYTHTVIAKTAERSSKGET